MRYRCINCPSYIDTPLGDSRRPQSPCECGGILVDRGEYRELFAWKSRMDRDKKIKSYKPLESNTSEEPENRLENNLSFEQFIKQEAEKFKESDLYPLLDKEFDVIRKEAERALRSKYEFVDAWLLDDYILLFEVKDKDLSNLKELLKEEKVNYYLIDNFLAIFLDEKINYTHRTKLGKLFKDYFNIEMDLHYPDKIIKPLMERDIIKPDMLYVKSIQTNHIALVDKESYSIKPSKTRLIIV